MGYRGFPYAFNRTESGLETRGSGQRPDTLPENGRNLAQSRVL